MPNYNNIDGTIKDIFTLGKGQKAGLQNIDGQLAYKDFGGDWQMLSELFYYTVNTMVKSGLDSDEILTVPQGYTKLVPPNFYIDGSLTIDGDLCEV